MIGNWVERNWFVLSISLVWAALQIPFLSSAFRIDEPYFLAVAKQISSHPLDPYGFQINWDGAPEWAFKTSANPPFVPAYLAVWRRFFPENEVSLHSAMLPFSLLALHAFGVMARYFKIEPLIPLALLGGSPAFFLGSQVVMQDVPMLSLFLLAISYATIYEEKGCRLAFFISWLAAFCCPMAKYNGLVLVPLLGWLFMTAKRKLGIGIIACAPLFALLLWNGFTWVQYGRPHFLAMAAFEKTLTTSTPPWLLTKGVLASIGLGVLPISVVAFIPYIQPCRNFILSSSVCVFPLAYWHAATGLGYGILSSGLFALSVTLSFQLIVVTFSQGWECLKTRDQKGLLLVLWILFGIVFQGGLMFTSVRYVLFLAPPAILLILMKSSRAPGKWILGGSLAANFFLVIAIALGDRQIANVYRDVVAQKIAPLWQENKGKFYFSGHWGFQYYAEKVGGEAINKYHPPIFQSGDLLVIASSAWPDILQPRLAQGLRVQTEIETSTRSWIFRTIGCNAGANFYANRISGCSHPTLLPFAFSRDASETFWLYVF
ncbi:MAG: hypothetical protein DMG05_11535 [Acidobacteria bacterium]|nr:MAG: hypothetical protein DMG05_11535 [Acidobacteriota bacterium]